LGGVGARWDCVPRVCGGGDGCAGGGVPLGAVPVLSWCGEVSLGGIQSSCYYYYLYDYDYCCCCYYPTWEIPDSVFIATPWIK